MSPFEQNCRKLFKDRGYRITRARSLLFDLLSRTTKALTAQQIHQELARSTPPVDLASIYRNLQVLKELDLVHQVLPTGGYVACDHEGHAATEHHALLLCRVCQRSQEIHLPKNPLRDLGRHIAARTEFSLSDEALIFHGTCRRCAPKGRPRP